MSNQSGTEANNGSQFNPHPSPADSLMSSFGGSTGDDSGYAGSPLFGTVNPAELSIGRSNGNSMGDFTLFDNDQSNSVRFAEDTKTDDNSTLEQPGQTKKEVKKRKSWGQQLPAPTTNLPPRKRAKTDDEKEQRRIERVLRNRRAAQSSRERKREEAEKLQKEKDSVESRCQKLEKALREERTRSNALANQLIALGHTIKPAEDLFIDSSPYQRAADARHERQESSPFPDEVHTPQLYNPQQTANSLPRLEDNFEQLPPTVMSHQYNPNFDANFGYHEEIEQHPKTIDPAHLSPEVSHQSSPSISPAMKPCTNSDPTLFDMSHSAVVDDLPCQSDREELKRNQSWGSKSVGSITQFASVVSTGWSYVRGA